MDQKELTESPLVKSDEYGLSFTMQQEERVYDLAKLREIEKATLELFIAQEAKGAKAKGLPVSYMHEIEMRIQGAAPKGTLERSGTIYDVHVCEGAEGYPAGLYAMIEWTPKAFAQIESGEWLDLSIALASGYRLADGTIVNGECMFAAALVDIGFFEAIPSARDGLPAEAFSGSLAAEVVSMYRRSLQRRFYARETMEVKLRMDDVMLEQMKGLIVESMAPYADRLSAIETQLAALMELQKEDLADHEGMTDALENLVEHEAAEAEAGLSGKGSGQKAATATTTMNSAAPEALAARIASKVAPHAEAKIAEVVQAHIECGRLLPANVRSYAMALAKGDVVSADAMLGDFTGLAFRSGSGIAPQVEVRSVNTKKSAADIISDIEAEGKLRKGTQPFVTEMYRRINKARESGILV
jgi:phage I-like protein